MQTLKALKTNSYHYNSPILSVYSYRATATKSIPQIGAMLKEIAS